MVLKVIDVVRTGVFGHQCYRIHFLIDVLTDK